MRGTSAGRDRGTTPALTYVLAIGIVTLLISGLLIATTDFVDGERERVVRDELEIVGERLAADAMAVDRLAGAGATTTQRTTVPETVAGVGYYVDVVGCPSGNACLALTSADPSIDLNVTVPVNNRSAMRVTRAVTRTIRIEVTSGPGPSPDADADRSVDPTIGIARDVSPGLDSSGDLFEADTAPVVSGVSYSPAPPAPDETITFESDVTTFLDGNYTYRWDLDGDGTIDESGNATEAAAVGYTYTDPGRYNVSLQVVGPNNQSDTVNRLVRVSGLVRSNPNVSASSVDTDGKEPTAGFELSLENNFASESATITDVEIDPTDPSVRRLNNPNGPEVLVESGEYDDDAITLYENGTLVQLEDDSDQISVGGTTTLQVGEFYDSTILTDSNQYATSGQSFEVAVRYETDDQENYVSRFTVTPDGPPPSSPPGSDPEAPSVENVDASGECQYDGYYGHVVEIDVEVTASDPNGVENLDRAEFDLVSAAGDEITVVRDFDEDDDTIRIFGDVGRNIRFVEVTAYDGAGLPSSPVSLEVTGCS